MDVEREERKQPTTLEELLADDGPTMKLFRDFPIEVEKIHHQSQLLTQALRFRDQTTRALELLEKATNRISSLETRVMILEGAIMRGDDA